MIPNLALIRMFAFAAPISGSLIYAYFTHMNAQAALGKVADLGGEVASLKRDIELRTARESALRWRLKVRDDAIEQSKCKATLEKWVKDPSLIPKPFKQDGDLRPDFVK